MSQIVHLCFNSQKMNIFYAIIGLGHFNTNVAGKLDVTNPLPSVYHVM